MDLLKMLSTNEVIAQVISFLILLFLLRIFAWKKLLGLLDARKERIASEFKQIDDTRREVAKLKTDYEAKISSIEETAKAKIQEAIDEGKKITEEVRKEANQEAQDIINNAKKNIQYEISKAKEELKEKIVDLTISATENMIKEKLTEKQDRKIVEGFLESVDKL